ncbi:serine O-acetyltransferase [Larkinella terrae]|uniref:Serine acetyltransferase n=1 Tax=Larkinella terrae TaxID=2025311 RepID=A0A7K0EUT9_9BACT|nr:serine acetyltransferase [Larkinella terrae]MRS65532.1 serine acetyltransferase [Larkinella terrae]
MDYLIKSDLYRYAGNTDLMSFIRCLRIPGFRYTYFLRKVAIYSKFTIPGFIYRLFYYRYTYKYGFQIPRETTIGRGFQISHFGCIVINSKSKIGDNCYVSHNVTIGQTNRGKLKGYPTLGDKVWVGAGAVIVGGVTIGSNVLIAPNAYVNFDVPSNCIVMGNPGRIIPNDNATQEYIVNTV